VTGLLGIGEIDRDGAAADFGPEFIEVGGRAAQSHDLGTPCCQECPGRPPNAFSGT
jgi:hypothetical protein